jgi:hypothetical protein
MAMHGQRVLEGKEYDASPCTLVSISRQDDVTEGTSIWTMLSIFSHWLKETLPNCASFAVAASRKDKR